MEPLIIETPMRLNLAWNNQPRVGTRFLVFADLYSLSDAEKKEFRQKYENMGSKDLREVYEVIDTSDHTSVLFAALIRAFERKDIGHKELKAVRSCFFQVI